MVVHVFSSCTREADSWTSWIQAQHSIQKREFQDRQDYIEKSCLKTKIKRPQLGRGGSLGKVITMQAWASEVGSPGSV